MIRYDLLCRDCSHRFDSWFSSSDGYTTLEKSGLLECPSCSGHHVGKALMAPAVARATRPAQAAVTPPGSTGSEVTPVPMPAHPSPGTSSMLVRQALRQVRREIESTAENVGTRFAEEARRMHAGQAPMRPVYGEATAREIADLREAEVPVYQVPWLQDDS